MHNMSERKMIYSPGVCASCGSDKLLYSDPIIEDELIYPYECEDCHAKGKEYYDLLFSFNEAGE
jgi:hypothetical protein